MKIYEQKPNYLVRIQISKNDEESQYITLCETTPEDVEKMCIAVIDSLNLSPFIEGRRTSINIRESADGKNGKSRSISFKGLNPEEAMKQIINHINN
tara:strand:- start:2037 stop:2327 length:291 start_codon:yes stop_codon:yes gene_type:complete